MKRNILIAIIVIALLSGVVAGAITTSYSESISVSYGEISYTESDLQITNVEEVGPGIHTDEIHITVENPTESSIDAQIEFWLMNDDVVEREGSSSESIAASTETTIEFEIDRIREQDYDDIQLRIEEE